MRGVDQKKVHCEEAYLDGEFQALILKRHHDMKIRVAQVRSFKASGDQCSFLKQALYMMEGDLAARGYKISEGTIHGPDGEQLWPNS